MYIATTFTNAPKTCYEFEYKLGICGLSFDSFDTDKDRRLPFKTLYTLTIPANLLSSYFFSALKTLNIIHRWMFTLYIRFSTGCAPYTNTALILI